MFKWSSIGGSIQGFSHILNDKPCQDSMGIKYDDENKFFIGCVADGHGGEAYIYSDEGALVAVEVVQELFHELLCQDNIDDIFYMLKNNKDMLIPKRIESRWKAKVKQVHLAKNRTFMKDKELFYLYGTTILAVVITKKFVFALQLGDGDLIFVNSLRQVNYLIKSEEQNTTETFSLCLQDSWQYMDTELISFDDGFDPIMFLLSTDGYSNSFVTSNDFLKAGNDILNYLKNEGNEYVQHNIHDWLNDYSKNGSGDDISLIMVYDKTFLSN